MNQDSQTGDTSNEYHDRLEKIKQIREMKINPYPDSYKRTHKMLEAKDLGEKKGVRKTDDIINKPNDNIKISGRLMSFRNHGNISFGQLQDDSGQIQICFMKNVVGIDEYKFLKKIDVADFLGCQGELFKTKHGEITLLVTRYILLSKSLRPLPEKFHGLKDQETQYRQRYLDLTINEETKKRFDMRSDFIQALREFYWQNGFREIETPILSSSASGALAKPFLTHHEALDHDFFLRIAGGETYLKETIGGGYEKVFEIGKVFRNEGMDPSHLQEFTMNEFYHAYWNYKDLMQFTEDMFEYLLKKTLGTLEIEIKDRDGTIQKVNFKTPWEKISMKDAIMENCGIDIEKHNTAKDLLDEIKSKNIIIEEAKNLGRGNLIDQLYKKVARPKMIGPLFLIQHPTDLSPLARRNDENPTVVDRFQVIVNGWEIVNAYSELINPIEQAKAFNQQAQEQEKGDEEAHGKDDEFVQAMEHGFPPIAGWGMGIDRIIALLTNQDNLKDVVLFPLMRPLE
ncbi:lysine--tRNA ligase [bacterium]|nr:lysine--tRNA ligase [bacterium]